MKITDFGYDGEGVGHIDGKVCFVPYTLLGEEVSIKPVKETNSFIKARVSKILSPSDKRIKAPCPYFGVCGGCDFQHMSYDDELELKQQILLRQLNKVGYFGKVKIVKSDKEYGYRNKIKLFPCEKGLGLKRAESDKVVHIQKCLLIDEKMNDILEKVQAFVCGNYLQKDLINVVIRRINETYCVWFIFNNAKNLDFTGLSLLLGDCLIFTSVNLNSPRLVFNQKSQKSVEFGLKQDLIINAFRQVNDQVCVKLYSAVCEELQGETIVNAYSGAGALSALLARRANKVYGIELGRAEHESAERLKETNEIQNLENLHGKCEDILPRLDVKYDAIVLDPPRSGCQKEVCEAIDNSAAQKVCYISCNPASLVRDLARFKNFQIKRVTLFDMFPQTANFEVLAILERNPI